MPDPITPPVVPDPNAPTPPKVDAVPTIPAAPTLPQTTGVDTTAQTKAFSDLYNQNKTLNAEHVKLQAEMTEVKKQIQTQSDAGKDVEQLKLELNDQRTKAEDSAQRMTAFDESMKGLLTAAELELSDEQKKQLEFASDDPFKRLQFIQTMKATVGVTTKTSQGGGITDDPGTGLNVSKILERAAQGDMKAYREAKTKYGDKEVKDYIAKHTQQRSVAITPPS